MPEKKFVFTVEEIGSDKLIKKLAELRLALVELGKQMQEANKAGDVKKFEELAIAQDMVKREIAATSKELKAQNKAFEDAKYPTDSLRSMQRDYSRLATQIRDMNQAQRESDGGQRLINTAKSLKDEINKQSMAFGDNTKNIGNYTQSIQKAIENPLKALKNAGIVGILATIGVKLFDMGKSAVEAFSKTEEGAKKMKGVQLGFERLKAVGMSLFTNLITAALPFIEKIIPFIVKGVVLLASHFSGLFAAGKALFTNLVIAGERFGNALAIVWNQAKALFGDETAKTRVAELRAENKLLEAGIEDVGDAYLKAFREQKVAGEAAAANAKIQEKAQKTVLEGLKEQEKSIQNIISNRIAMGKATVDQEQQLKKVREQIIAVETKLQQILANNNEEKLAARRDALTASMKKLTAGTDEYTAAAKELAVIQVRLESIESQRNKAIEKQVKNLEELNHLWRVLNGLVNQGKVAELPTIKRTTVEDLKQTTVKSDTITFRSKGETDLSGKLQKESIKSVADFEKKVNAERRKELDDQLQAEQQKAQTIADFKKQVLADSIGQGAELIADLLSQQLANEQKQIDKTRDKRLESLNKEYDKKKAFAAGNSSLLVKLEAERAQKEEEINKKAAKESKRIAIQQALINGALAAVNMLARTVIPFPTSLLGLIPIALATAKQISVINASSLAEGGYTDFVQSVGSSNKSFNNVLNRNAAGHSKPLNDFISDGGMTDIGGARDSTGERVSGLAILHGEEYVAPRPQVKRLNPIFRILEAERTGSIHSSMVPEAINQVSGKSMRKYASGGFTVSEAMYQMSGKSLKQYASGGFTVPVFTNQSTALAVGGGFRESSPGNSDPSIANIPEEQMNMLAGKLYRSSYDSTYQAMIRANQDIHRRSDRDKSLQERLTL